MDPFAVEKSKRETQTERGDWEKVHAQNMTIVSALPSQIRIVSLCVVWFYFSIFIVISWEVCGFVSPVSQEVRALQCRVEGMYYLSHGTKTRIRMAETKHDALSIVIQRKFTHKLIKCHCSAPIPTIRALVCAMWHTITIQHCLNRHAEGYYQLM